MGPQVVVVVCGSCCCILWSAAWQSAFISGRQLGSCWCWVVTAQVVNVDIVDPAGLGLVDGTYRHHRDSVVTTGHTDDHRWQQANEWFVIVNGLVQASLLLMLHY